MSTIPSGLPSTGGRYQFKDDWQFYDTLVTSFDYQDKMISWEGKSCQGMKFYNRDRGAAIMGTTGTVVVDRDGYEIYDLKGNKTSEFKTGKMTSSSDLRGADSMTDAHFRKLHRGHPQRRKTECSDCCRKRVCDHTAAFQYRLGSQPRVSARHGKTARSRAIHRP